MMRLIRFGKYTSERGTHRNGPFVPIRACRREHVSSAPSVHFEAEAV